MKKINYRRYMLLYVYVHVALDVKMRRDL